MPFYDPIRIGASASVATAFTVDRSARFRGATDQRFDRTLSTTSSSYTVSMWFKTTPVTTNFSRGLFTLGPANNTDVAGVVFNTDDKLIFYGGNGTSSITNARVFRDTSAWYHFTYSVNSNNFTAYINGESLQTGTVRSLDTTSNGFRLGGWWGGYDLFQGYIADFYLIDGLALTPSSFTETNAETGQLVPKLYTGSFGTSGAHLTFADNSGTTATTLGKDTSGNGNNFTPTSFAVSDAVKDSPTNNFPTWNPLSNYDGMTLVEGNLKANSGGGWDQVRANMGVSSGKWYFEIRCNEIDGGAGSERWIGGIHEMFGRDPGGTFIYNSSYTAASYGYAYGVQDGNKKRKNQEGDVTFSSDVSAGKVVGVRMNLDDNEILISVDGVDKGKMYDIQGGRIYTPFFNGNNSGTGASLNCGQDSTFAGQETAGGNSDSGGIGDFAYAVPSGYKALCSANLADPSILLPNNHFETKVYEGTGSTQNITGINFQPDWVWMKSMTSTNGHAVVDSVRGRSKIFYPDTNQDEDTSGSSNDLVSFNSDGFTVGTPQQAGSTNNNSLDIVAWNWNAGDTDGKTYTVKVVSDSGNKYRFDDFGTSAVTLNLAEGGTYIFDQSDSSNATHPLRFSTTADGTHGGGTEYTTGVTTTGTPGSSGAKTTIVVAAAAPNLYYYCSNHSGMGGSVNTNSTLGSSNFDGDTTPADEVPIVKANPTAGFSIVSYKQQTGTYHIGHGLGVPPELIITKTRSSANSWWTHTTVIDGSIDYGALDLTQAFQDSGVFGIGVPTSLVFEDDTDFTSDNADNMAYLFSSVDGFSRVGSYRGNGDTDGIFVFTNFRPAWIMMKETSSSSRWSIYDNKRDTNNPNQKYLRAQATNAETTSVNNDVDFLSNGFKMRGTGEPNASGITYLYLAFAEAPYKNARAK